jgi:conjugal transfer mating pair stabilization protein TraN
MASMEAAREAGVYGEDLRLFKGVGERCRKKLFGSGRLLQEGRWRCGRSNHNLMATAMQGVMIGGQLAINAGSKYMFDFMYPEFTSYIEAGAQAMISSEVLFTPTNFQPSFTFYGLTFSTGTVSSGLLGGPIYSLGSLGASICTSIRIPWRQPSRCNSCPNCCPANNPNSLLAMHRDANLCVHVGSYCSARIPIIRTCIEQTQSYCCFNSRLARIINEQGRGQVGKSWGSGESPDCSGFTTAEFERWIFPGST